MLSFCYVNLNHEYIAVGIGVSGLFECPVLKSVFILYHHA